MSLKEYHRKRDFKRTGEPYGNKAKSRKKLIYVIQKHAASHMHYDFRLELDGVLKSWAVPKGPSLDPKVKHLAVHVEDHPIDYADFEGVIPQGEYGGGTVMVWDTGYWEPLDEDVHKAYEKGNLTIDLHGKKLHGRWKLIRLRKNFEKNAKEQWLLFKVADEYSKGEDEYVVTVKKPNSAVSKRNLEQIAKAADKVWTNKPDRQNKKKKSLKKKPVKIKASLIPNATKKTLPLDIRPELATLMSEPPRGEEWLHEIKWDGYRILARVKKNKVSLLTRRNNDWTHNFPSIAHAIETLKLKDCILDGELVALDKNNKANFQILQNSLEEENLPDLTSSLIYYVFDLLYYDGYSLLSTPLIERKKILEKVLSAYEGLDQIKYNDHIIGNGQQVFDKACKYHLEGIVSKKIDSPYAQRRTKEWQKIKCTERQEFVIGGYTDPKSTREHFGALLVGFYNNKHQLVYCGKVGTGFTHQSLKELAVELTKHEQHNNPFEVFPKMSTRSVHWVKPVLVGEIEYMCMTDDGILRHPSFKGLREDKKSKSVKLEKPMDNNKLKFTNLNKVLYPSGFTKRDLLDYYELVEKWILPHVKNRPITLVRCPHGSNYKCFYQKHFTDSTPSTLKQVEIQEHGKVEPYIYLNNLEGLLGLVQMGVLELHPWGSSIKNTDKPDRIIFDLDPAPDVAWGKVVDCAFILHQFLDQLGLQSFVKTTGGKGLHVVAPIRATFGWEEIRNFTKQIADLMVELSPNKYIATMSKQKRTGKIFIDYLRNTRGATAIAPYSTRARDNATIAVPLYWDELATKKIHSDTFNLKNIGKRFKSLKHDPWDEMLKVKQSITVKMMKLVGLD